MELNMASKVSDVMADPAFPEERKILVNEALVGHGLTGDITVHELCQHVAFITRPELILAFDQVLGATNG